MNKTNLELDNNLRDFIREHPNSNLAWAYKLGRKDASLELTKSLNTELKDFGETK